MNNLEIQLSDFVEAFIYVNGMPFKGDYGFESWPFLVSIYNDPTKYMILKSSRQCSKSTTVGNVLLSYSAIESGFKSLYVAPRQEQLQTFSSDRLNTVIEQSPIIKKMTSSKLTLKVTEKQFVNNSIIRLRSSYKNPDRARSVASRLICIDEIQDINIDFIPVILECSATFPTNKKIMFTGTPLSMENAIEYYWSKESTMSEWMVKCPACGYWNGVKLENIGIDWYICKKCSGELDVRSGQWVATRPKAAYSGYHINQLMTPYTYKDWSALVHKHKTYMFPNFMNEVLGESYDSGVKPITREQLLACCKGYPMIRIPTPEFSAQMTIAGIDWGLGDGHSYTVLTILVFFRDKFKVVFAKRYAGMEANQDTMLLNIKELMHRFNVNMIGADYGMGHYYNYALAQEFENKVVPMYYSDNVKKKIAWDRKGAHLTINKRMVIEDIFQLLKKEDIILPHADEYMEPFGEDILNEFIEESTTSKARYTHSPERPDDALHSLVYAVIASQLIRPRQDIFKPHEWGQL